MRAVFIVCCLLSLTSSMAQDYPRKELELDKIADDLYGVPDSDLNYEELYENLVQSISNPSDLNKATADDLRFLRVLTDAQIATLINHRIDNGDFLSIYELQAIPGFDLPTIHKLLPFVTVKDPGSRVDGSLIKRALHESDNYFLMRYERTQQTKNGFTSDTEQAYRFKGSPDKVYVRFRSSKSGDFSVGFTAEKDAGENIVWNPSARYYGFDYLSYHLQLQNKGRIKNIIVGDYQSQFGQGLMLGGILGMGKGGETITTARRNNIGLLPYTSAFEGGNLRGAAATIEATDRILVTGFYSQARKDATVQNDVEDDVISSFQNTGLHRNEKELLARKKVGEKNFGGVVTYKQDALELGLMFNHTQFTKSVQRKDSPYNQFAFRGISNQNVGLYVNYTFENATFFSELSHSLQGGYAGIIGAIASLSNKFDLSLSYRKYDRNFHSFYSNGFGEGSTTQNETGIYWGWKYTFSRKFSLSGYGDIFKFPWLRFRNYAPSEGYEWLARFMYDPSRKVKIILQAREESKTRNVDADQINLYQISEGQKNNYQVSIDCTTHPTIRFKSRAQFSTFRIQQHITHGLAIMQDLIVDIGKLKFTGRYGVFDTEDYDNRQYAYENDVWLAYSLPAYEGNGVRKMVMLEYKLNKHLSFWLRYAHIRYRHQENIGTSVDRIVGDKKNDIKFQVLLKF